MASFITFLRNNREVCTTGTTLSEARNKLASNKTKITKMSSVLANLGKEIGHEKAKEPKNVDLINRIINEHQVVKENIYGLISQLIPTSHEFYT